MNSDKTDNIDKLIPEMFDQMRSNFESKLNSPIHNRTKNNKLVSTNISTQSLLKELEALDKIIPMIENINKNLKSVLPSHITKIQETCKTTNMILDSWISIHSQAGYIHQLMTKQQLNGDIDTSTIEKSKSEVNELKKVYEELQNKRDSVENKRFNSKGTFSLNKRPNNIRKVQKPSPRELHQNKLRNAYRERASNIPNISSRITRPTASSQRKMFK
ncbi:hypothetical protein TPHA_0J01780 [Tetrapisispora phaffii CBS 4417]|uniref:DASH complex subunit DUO1 n=1 Tax=Tetrapisispora phaffii (strain ATCC 24235 / CBS 4417 / NBRC 1672 / NRRL Y-8282 / UCD 70-5) TaxID=1071381 RepID=G8BYQ7_TETPH|nr:hypothetical protein TPHA_0J01780 [Tetrapisispora phaffii CBS 4417]CCE64999.1 hypothetical protein TPHA_0J01780 [Tetrapisispora phaffii CBS 4417]